MTGVMLGVDFVAKLIVRLIPRVAKAKGLAKAETPFPAAKLSRLFKRTSGSYLGRRCFRERDAITRQG